MVYYRINHDKDDSPFARSASGASPAAMQGAGMSGHSLQGGTLDGTVHMCYRFFVDYSRCYAMSLEDKECRLQWEDYMECKTMVKETMLWTLSALIMADSTRAQTIFDQFAANQRAAGHSRLEVRRQLKQGLPAAIGLIDADAELARKVADAPKGVNKEFDVKFYHDGKPKHPMPGYVEYK